jgi:hypothetical protein
MSLFLSILAEGEDSEGGVPVRFRDVATAISEVAYLGAALGHGVGCHWLMHVAHRC